MSQFGVSEADTTDHVKVKVKLRLIYTKSGNIIRKSGKLSTKSGKIGTFT